MNHRPISAMRRGALGLSFATAFAAALTVAVPTVDAQPAECFPTEDTPAWEAENLGAVTDGASRPATGDGLELCSAGSALDGTAESWRYLVRRIAGDFVFETTVTSVDEGATAGAIARRDPRKIDSPWVGIVVTPDPSGGWLLQSWVRDEDEGEADATAVPPVTVTPPVTLRIEREGDVFTTSYAEGAGAVVEHLAVDLTGSGLATDPLSVGIVTAADGTSAPVSAGFETAGFEAEATPPPDVSGCVDGTVVPLAGGSEITLAGRNLDSVRSVRIGGAEAAIVSATATELVVTAPPAPADRDNANIVVEGSGDPRTLNARVVWAGEPFVRGDLSGDGRVRKSDANKLRRFLDGRKTSLPCPEAADVNADRAIDEADYEALLAFVAGAGPAPAAPFPEAGFAPAAAAAAVRPTSSGSRASATSADAPWPPAPCWPRATSSR